ncbi:MAG: hypothetical protein LBK68_02100 [Candidatus Margulisbacteria bacterium]|jgi:hypothetical protein|nr:hypothetical protein [Candidatus Margulisiibacteriota bacterium]
MVANIRGTLDAGMLAAGLNATVPANAAYIARAAENGVYNATASDSASLSRGFARRGQLSIEEDNGSYIYNIKQYDVIGAVNSDNDSYYLVSYNGECSFVDAAFGYSDLSKGYNSVDTYIDPFDPEISKLLTQIPELNDQQLSTEEKLAKLYNHIINNFNSVPEDKDDWNFVGETIFQRGGDCEDLSVLLASAMIALLMNEGMDYQTANSRVSAVAGKHALYGDHVFVEYLADDGQTYALDAAFAKQGNITKLSDLKQVSELKFDVYFRFNDNKVFGTAARLESLENTAKAYIDPTDPALSKFLAEFEGAMDLSGLSMDEITAKLFNYIKTEYQCLDLHDVFPSQSLVIDTKAGASQNLALLAVNSLLALAAKTGASLPNARVSEATDKASGEKQWVMLYQDASGVDRVFDFSDKIVSPQLQLGLVKTADDLLSINSYVSTDALSLSADFGQEYSLSNNLYSRTVQRFNPKAGYVSEGTSSTYGKLSQSDVEKISSFYSSGLIFGTSSVGRGLWDPFKTNYESAKAIINKLKPKSGDSNGIDSNLSGRTDVWGVNQFKTQEAISAMTNIGKNINSNGDFWSFDDATFEAARSKFLSQRNILAFLAMVMEAQNEAYNIVGSELERVGSEEAYKSMKASQIIQAETDTLLKDVNELKKEAVGVVNQHNQLMESVINKEIDEVQKDKNRVLSLLAATTSVVFAAVSVPAISIASGTSKSSFLTTISTIGPGAAAIPGIIAMVIGSAIAAPMAAMAAWKGAKNAGLAAQLAAAPLAGAAAIIGVLATGVAVNALVATGIIAATLGTGTAVAAAVVTATAMAALAIGATIANTILASIPSMVSSSITLAQDMNRAEAADAKWRDTAVPKAAVAGKSLTQVQNNSKTLIEDKNKSHTSMRANTSSESAKAMSANMQSQYSLLDEAVKTKFKMGADGLIYDNDEKFIILERELSRWQNINRILVSMHSTKAQSRNAVHTEMTSQSGYTTSQLATSMTELEQSIIMEKFNELKTLRQEYISSYNANLSAAANADMYDKKVRLESGAFTIGLMCAFLEVPMDPSAAMGIAQTLFGASEALWDRDDVRREFQMSSVINGTESGANYSGGDFGKMVGAGAYAIAGELDVLDMLEKEWNKGVHIGLDNKEIGKSNEVNSGSGLPNNPIAGVAQSIIGGASGILDWFTSLFGGDNPENEVRRNAKVNGLTSNIDSVAELDGQSKEKIDVGKANYQVMYRARIAWMRYQATVAINIKRAQFMVQRYNLESRNIVHQEMTNATTYQVSGLAEQALSAEFQYVSSIIAAYAQREEQRIQTRNSMIEREQQRWKQNWLGMAGPFGYIVSPILDRQLTKSYAHTAQPDITGIHGNGNGINSVDHPDAANKLDEVGTRIYDRDGILKTNASDYTKIYTNSDLYTTSEKGLIQVEYVGVKGFGRVASYSVNFANMQTAQAEIYGLTYLNAIWQSLYNARSASRSMVHQVLTNISNLTLSSYSGSAVGAENQLIQSKAQDLISNTNDIVNIKQKIFDAEQAAANEEMKMYFGLAGLGVAAICITALTLISGFPQIGSAIKLMNGMSAMAVAIYSFFESIFTYINLNKLQEKQQKELKDATEKAKGKKNVDGENSGNLADQAMGDADPLAGTDGNGAAAKFQLSLMQANLKKMERINAMLRKVHRAKGESRGKISAKISGISAANIPSAAEMVAGLESGVAEAIMNLLVSKASALDSTQNKMDAQIDKMISSSAGMLTQYIKNFGLPGPGNKTVTETDEDGKETEKEVRTGVGKSRDASNFGKLKKSIDENKDKYGEGMSGLAKFGAEIAGFITGKNLGTGTLAEDSSGNGSLLSSGAGQSVKGIWDTLASGVIGKKDGGAVGLFKGLKGKSSGSSDDLMEQMVGEAVDSETNGAGKWGNSGTGIMGGIGAAIGSAAMIAFSAGLAALKTISSLLSGDFLDLGTDPASYNRFDGGAGETLEEPTKPEEVTPDKVTGGTIDDTVINPLEQGTVEPISLFDGGGTLTGEQGTESGAEIGVDRSRISGDGDVTSNLDQKYNLNRGTNGYANGYGGELLANAIFTANNRTGSNGTAFVSLGMTDAEVQQNILANIPEGDSYYDEKSGITFSKNEAGELIGTATNPATGKAESAVFMSTTQFETHIKSLGLSPEQMASVLAERQTSNGQNAGFMGSITVGSRNTDNFTFGSGSEKNTYSKDELQAAQDSGSTVSVAGKNYKVEMVDGKPVLQEVVTLSDEQKAELAAKLGPDSGFDLDKSYTPSELNTMIDVKNKADAAAMDTSNLEAQKAAIADLRAKGVTIADDASAEDIQKAIDTKNGDIAAKNVDIIKELQGKGLDIPDNATQKQIDDAVDAENTRRQGVADDANTKAAAEYETKLAEYNAAVGAEQSAAAVGTDQSNVAPTPQENKSVPVELSNGLKMQIVGGQVQISDSKGKVIMVSAPEDADKIKEALASGSGGGTPENPAADPLENIKLFKAGEAGEDGAYQKTGEATGDSISIGKIGSGAKGGRAVGFESGTTTHDNNVADIKEGEALNNTINLAINALAELVKNGVEQDKFAKKMKGLSGGEHVAALLAGLDPRDAAEVMSVLTNSYSVESQRSISNSAALDKSMVDLVGNDRSPGTITAWISVHKHEKAKKDAEELLKAFANLSKDGKITSALNAPWLSDTDKMTIATMIKNGRADEAARVLNQISETLEKLNSIADELGLEGGAAVIAQYVKDNGVATVDEKGNVTVTLKAEARTQLLNGNIPGVSVNANQLEAMLKKLNTVDFSGEGGGVPKFKIGAGVKGYEKAYEQVSNLQRALGSRVQQKGLDSIQSVTLSDGQEIEFVVDPESREVLLPPGKYSPEDLQIIATEAANSLPDGDAQPFKINFQKMENGQPVVKKDAEGKPEPILMSAVVTTSIGANGKLQVDSVGDVAELNPAAATDGNLKPGQSKPGKTDNTSTRPAEISRYEAFSQLREVYLDMRNFEAGQVESFTPDAAETYLRDKGMLPIPLQGGDNPTPIYIDKNSYSMKDLAAVTALLEKAGNWEVCVGTQDENGNWSDVIIHDMLNNETRKPPDMVAWNEANNKAISSTDDPTALHNALDERKAQEKVDTTYKPTLNNGWIQAGKHNSPTANAQSAVLDLLGSGLQELPMDDPRRADGFSLLLTKAGLATEKLAALKPTDSPIFQGRMAQASERFHAINGRAVQIIDETEKITGLRIVIDSKTNLDDLHAAAHVSKATGKRLDAGRTEIANALDKELNIYAYKANNGGLSAEEKELFLHLLDLRLELLGKQCGKETEEYDAAKYEAGVIEYLGGYKETIAAAGGDIVKLREECLPASAGSPGILDIHDQSAQPTVDQMIDNTSSKVPQNEPANYNKIIDLRREYSGLSAMRASLAESYGDIISGGQFELTFKSGIIERTFEDIVNQYRHLGIPPSATKGYQTLNGLYQIFLGMPKEKFQELTGMTNAEYEDFAERINYMMNKFGELINDIPNLDQITPAGHSTSLGQTGNNAELNTRDRVRLLDNDWDMAGRLLANRREDNELEKQILEMNKDNNYLDNNPAESGGKILQLVLANKGIDQISAANINNAYVDLATAVTGGKQDEIEKSLAAYKESLVDAKLLAGEYLNNFDELSTAYLNMLQDVEDSNLNLTWETKLGETPPEGFSGKSLVQQRNMLTGLFAARCPELLTRPSLPSFHESSIMQDVSSGNIKNLGPAGSRELFARGIVQERFTMLPSAQNNATPTSSNPGNLITSSQSDGQNSEAPSTPIEVDQVTFGQLANFIVSGKLDGDKSAENIEKFLVEGLGLTSGSEKFNEYKKALEWIRKDSEAYADFVKICQAEDAKNEELEGARFFDDTRKAMQKGSATRDWHSALEKHFGAQLKDSTILNSWRGVDNALTEASRSNLRSPLVSQRVGNALEVNEQMRAQAFHDEVITPNTTHQRGVTNTSSDYHEKMTEALKDLCTAGEPTITLADIVSGKFTPEQMASGKLYDTAPPWTLETDILGRDITTTDTDASGQETTKVTHQKGLLEIVREMSPATPVQYENKLSAILNTREVLLDETAGQPLSPELQAALIELNELEAQTARDLRDLGYGIDAENPEHVVAFFDESQRLALGNFNDSVEENTQAAALYQDAMKVFLRDKNPAISLDGGTQLCGADGKLPDVIANTGEEFNGVVGADGTNRAELGKVLGGDNNAGINDAMKAIFFVAASGGEPPVYAPPSGDLEPKIVPAEPTPINFNDAFKGDEITLGDNRQSFVNEIARGVTMIENVAGESDLEATLQSIGRITMQTSVNLTNSDNSIVDLEDNSGTGRKGAATIMDGRVATIQGVVREGLIQALYNEGQNGVELEDVEALVTKYLETNLNIAASYTCGSDKTERGYGYPNNRAHNWKNGEEYQKAQNFIAEQLKRENRPYPLSADLGQCSTLDNNTRQAGYENTTMGARKAEVEFSQTLPENRPTSWAVSGDINGDAENETGTISKNPAGEYTLEIGGKKVDISDSGDGKVTIAKDAEKLGANTTAEITFKDGEPTGFKVTVLTKPGTLQIIDHVADRELQKLASPAAAAPAPAESASDSEQVSAPAQNSEPMPEPV